MSSAIEVLKDKLSDARYYTCMYNPEEEDEDILAFKEAIVALEQKESDKGWVCDVCDRETASCLSLCPDCNDRKQGALEELWLIGKELTSFIGGDKSTNIERNRINNYIEKRIEELEKEGVEK